MNTIKFHADCVAILDMEDFWLVGFADQEFNPKQYLTLQRDYEDDDQDVALGMNTYHVERDGQQWSCYGGIEQFELSRNGVKITFDAKGRKQLEVDGMEITFRLDGRRFPKLRNRLEKIFNGGDCFSIRAK